MASPLRAKPSPSTQAGATGHHRIAALAAWLLCALAYLYTANGVAVREDDRTNAWHHYEYLVDGFLSGHLYLSEAPAPELLALPDPYDPARNYPYRLWDASLYHGKYYLYYGPTPAVLLMLPWKAITGHHLPQRLATGLFAVSGLAALALLLAGLRDRHFPGVTPTALFFVVLLAGHITWLPVVLRRPAFWELPIVAAVALLWWALYFCWRYFAAGRAAGWGVAAGVALAFALGARPTLLFAAAVVAILPVFPYRRADGLGGVFRRLLPIGLPLAIGLVALLGYNYLRFGSIFEFGQTYQLWGPPGQVNFVDERHIQHFSVRFLPFNSWTYLFATPEFSIYFPFLHPPWSSDLPRGYIATEEVYGLWSIVPALFAGLLAIRFAWVRRNEADRHDLRTIILGSAAASLFAAAILFCFAGACSRYIAELVAGWSIVAGVGVLILCDLPRTRLVVRVARLLGGAAAVWSILCVWLVSYEFRAFARVTQPRLYPMIAGTLNLPSYWLGRSSGQEFGPIAVTIRLAQTPTSGSTVLLGTGSEGMLNQLIIDRINRTDFQLRLAVNNLVMLQTPVLHADSDTIVAGCWAPWLYPPAAHPFWRQVAAPSERTTRQTLYQLQVGNLQWSARSIWGFDATRFEPFVRTFNASSPGCAWVEGWRHIEPMRMTAPPPQRAPNKASHETSESNPASRICFSPSRGTLPSGFLR